LNFVAQFDVLFVLRFGWSNSGEIVGGWEASIWSKIFRLDFGGLYFGARLYIVTKDFERKIFHTVDLLSEIQR
jgi:hypothetical protein